MYNVCTMIRKQLYLTPDLNQTVKFLSLQEHKAEAEIIREALELGIEVKAKKKAQTAKATLQGLADLGKELGIKGPADWSTNLDDYLYGDKE